MVMNRDRGRIKRLPALPAVLLKAADKATGHSNSQVPEGPARQREGAARGSRSAHLTPGPAARGVSASREGYHPAAPPAPRQTHRQTHDPGALRSPTCSPVLQPSTAPAPTPAARGPDSAPPKEEGGEAGASCSSPSVRASLIGVPSTHSTTSPPAASFSLLGKVIGERELHLQQQQPPAPSLRAPHRGRARRRLGRQDRQRQFQARPPLRGGGRRWREVGRGRDALLLPRIYPATLGSPPQPLRGSRSQRPPLCLTEQRGSAGSARRPRTPGLGPPPSAARSAAQLSLLSSPLRSERRGGGAKFTPRRVWPGRSPRTPGGPAALPRDPSAPAMGGWGTGRGGSGRARQSRAAAPEKRGRGCRSRGRRDAAAPAAAKNWTVSPSRGRRETRTAAPAAGEPRTRPGPSSLGGGVASLVRLPALERWCREVEGRELKKYGQHSQEELKRSVAPIECSWFYRCLLGVFHMLKGKHKTQKWALAFATGVVFGTTSAFPFQGE
ncbi:translation initiation factor IF-2-like [Motacilla alba alba]|uniref:translation initiation factor IF-2-like n=1 Tax=Motacilla alba alba TaxID=1094192 RepID=UPI0018D55419|nr:translation initiation factor IF-2-like [Motacilla alba alba]